MLNFLKRCYMLVFFFLGNIFITIGLLVLVYLKIINYLYNLNK